MKLEQLPDAKPGLLDDGGCLAIFHYTGETFTYGCLRKRGHKPPHRVGNHAAVIENVTPAQAADLGNSGVALLAIAGGKYRCGSYGCEIHPSTAPAKKRKRASA